MPTEMKIFDDEPIIVIRIWGDYDLTTELPKMVPHYLEVLSKQPEPVVWIVDVESMTPDVSAIVEGANLLARSENPLYHHPKISHVIYVSTLSFIRMAVRGMQTKAFGNVNISVVDTLEDALQKARQSG